MQIEDGHGSGNRLKITNDGGAFAKAVTIDTLHDASHAGTAYVALVDTVTYASVDGQSGLIYLKNTTADNVHIAMSFISNTALARFKLHRNPTTGTLITAGTDYAPVNLNFGSGNTFSGICKTGVSGQTVTDGTVVNSVNKPAGAGVFELQSAVILPRGASLALTVEPDSDTVVDFALWFSQLTTIK